MADAKVACSVNSLEKVMFICDLEKNGALLFSATAFRLY